MQHDNSDNSERSDNDLHSHGKSETRSRFKKCETLEDGMSAFMRWLNSEDKNLPSEYNPIVLLKFINDRHTILYDTNLHTQLDVEINNGVPYCKYYKQDDFAHVGFTIEVEQLFGHSLNGREETLADITA
jgi:hypothetical protein